MYANLDNYRLSAARAAHAHLVRLHRENTEKIVLEWLRENRKHPHANQVDSAITLYRLHGRLRDLIDANDYVTTALERN